MLVDLMVLLIVYKSSLIGSLSLDKVFIFLIKKTYLEESVDLPLHSEGVGQDGILEVADCLFDLVGLGEDHPQFIKNFALLVEVWRHLQNCYEGADCMIIRLEFLIKNADSVPKLRVLDII